jgi:hypothetical protein
METIDDYILRNHLKPEEMIDRWIEDIRKRHDQRIEEMFFKAHGLIPARRLRRIYNKKFLSLPKGFPKTPEECESWIEKELEKEKEREKQERRREQWRNAQRRYQKKKQAKKKEVIKKESFEEN